MEQRTASPPGVSDHGIALRILVVEDDEGSRSALATHLRLAGHDVVTAEDGAAAVQLAEATQPHVVVTDVCMPRMSGVELAQRLRHDLAQPPDIVLALTALATVTWLDMTSVQFDEVYAKPVDFEALVARIGDYAKFVRSRCTRL